MKPIIECKSLALGYEGKAVISDISFRVNEGDYLCIVGENGSGKSTLTKGILGLIKPINGTINISSAKIGYLPQSSEALRDFPVSVREVIISGCLTKGKKLPFYTKEDKQKCDEIAHMLDLCSLKNACFGELSGGQRQRVLLARALCASGNLLVLDEPANGLDPVITGEFYDIIQRLNHENNMTIVMISHDIKASLKYASHILYIGNDSMFFGTKEQFLSTDSSKYLSGGARND